MKQCRACKEFKNINEFAIKLDKYSNICKKCDCTRLKLHYKKYPWKRTFSKIKQRCENPTDKRYKDYGGKGIKCLITEEEIKELWFRDKSYLMKKPSIDRIKNDGNYEFSNCQFIELDINSIKDRVKRILQFSISGDFIKEWSSIIEIERTLNIDQSSIVRCCKNTYKTAGGFIWKYKF